ncbi:hypothetical protein H1R20_g3350, partial [Candolleomyces eurysporus]
MLQKAFAYAVAAALAALAADVTLVMLDDAPPAGQTLIASGTTLGASPVAVDQNSATIYAVSQVNSLLVYQDATTTATLLSTPVTETFTYRADASRYAAAMATKAPSGVEAGILETCQKQADGSLVCGQVFAVGQSQVGGVALIGATTGSAKPFATISNVESLRLPTTSIAEASVETGTPRSAGSRVQVGVFLSAVGVLAGALLV